MFGMLDYRAYKLLWLIWLPLGFMFYIAELGSVPIAIMINALLGYPVAVRIVIACEIVLGASIIIYGVQDSDVVHQNMVLLAGRRRAREG